MLDIVEVITNNIINVMKRNSISQSELANNIGVSKQTLSKILSGERMANATELASIAKALNVSIDTLVDSSANEDIETPIKTLMTKADSSEVKEGLEIADKLADLICFHVRCKENGESLNVLWNSRNS